MGEHYSRQPSRRPSQQLSNNNDQNPNYGDSDDPFLTPTPGPGAHLERTTSSSSLSHALSMPPSTGGHRRRQAAYTSSAPGAGGSFGERTGAGAGSRGGVGQGQSSGSRGPEDSHGHSSSMFGQGFGNAVGSAEDPFGSLPPPLTGDPNEIMMDTALSLPEDLSAFFDGSASMDNWNVSKRAGWPLCTLSVQLLTRFLWFAGGTSVRSPNRALTVPFGPCSDGLCVQPSVNGRTALPFRKRPLPPFVSDRHAR